jgi:hydroxyacylglutathione hydrolase
MSGADNAPRSYPMFQRFFEEGLAQCSFLIECDRTKRAVVIDPRRDAGVYLDAARQRGLTITHAIETHIHADFVSGARELAAIGARVVAGPGAGLGFEHQELADGERVSVGDVTLTFLHTPGHTPEHVSVLAEQSGEPGRLFTGDLLFVGAVGRPDLLGEEQSRRLAGQLFTSIQRVMALDDDVEVHPGHGAGSLCGTNIGKEPSSTIGRERAQNPMAQLTDRSAFVESVLGDLPETPPYFVRMKHVNQSGPNVLGLADGPRRVPPIRPAAAAALAADGAVIVDLRTAENFGAGHPEAAINIAFSPKVGYWAGWVISPGAPLILLADDSKQLPDAAVQLLRVGFERIEGYVSGGAAGWRGDGLPMRSIEQLSAAALRTALISRAGDPIHLVDVRSPKEWQAGHVDGAVNIPVGDLAAQAGTLPRDAVIATICEGGFRSSLAASLLEQEGITRLVNVTGGFAAYRALETL